MNLKCKLNFCDVQIQILNCDSSALYIYNQSNNHCKSYPKYTKITSFNEFLKVFALKMNALI